MLPGDLAAQDSIFLDVFGIPSSLCFLLQLGILGIPACVALSYAQKLGNSSWNFEHLYA